MSTDLIRYDLLVQDALRSVVRRVMGDVARNGLPGEHHFYISFKTQAPGVRISNRLRERHPEEMTIVLQHQFWDLGVTEHGFEVGLSFGGVPERLLVPYEALSGFWDPSVQFGLKFESSEAGAENDDDADGSEAESANADDTPPAPAGGRLSPPATLKPAKAAATRKEAGAAKATASPAEDAAAARDAANGVDGDKQADAASDAAAKPEAGAEVLSLDAFRKKK